MHDSSMQELESEPAISQVCSAYPWQIKPTQATGKFLSQMEQSTNSDLQLGEVVVHGKHQSTSPAIQSRREMIATTSQQKTDEKMVFPRSEFPRQESSSLHVSAMPFTMYNDIKTRGHSTENILSGLNGDLHSGDRYSVVSMKRPFSGEDMNLSVSEGKKIRFDSFCQGREEISQSDFEMALIKNSLTRKKKWMYTELLQKFGILPPTTDVKHERNTQRESVIRSCDTTNHQSGIREVTSTTHAISRARSTSPQNFNIGNTTFNGFSSIKMESRPSSAPCANIQGFSTVGTGKAGTYLKSPTDSKVFDDEGNCYIDSNDFDSFYKPKKGHKSQMVPRIENDVGTPVYGPSLGNHNSKTGNKLQYGVQNELPIGNIDFSEPGDLPRRGLNFTFHGTNGGYAVDHQSMPRIIAIHSIPMHGRQMMRKHAVAEISGSVYKHAAYETDFKSEKSAVPHEEAVDKMPQSGANWWPPSPDSIPEDMAPPREQCGLLKIMTPEDRKACGLTNEDTKSNQQEPEVKQEQVIDDDDVIVTKVTQLVCHQKETTHAPSNFADFCYLTTEQLRDLYTKQFSSDSTENSSVNRAFLLHLLALRAKRQQHSGDGSPKVAKQPRKKLTMKELCDKLANTRKRLEEEGLKWKRKLLLSLEVVLIKKIRRLERETGESAPEGLVLENKTHKCERRAHSEDGELGTSEMAETSGNLVAMVKDLTTDSDEEMPAAEQRRKRTERNSKSVSEIRGYDST